MTSPMETRSDVATVARVGFTRKMESSHICFDGAGESPSVTIGGIGLFAHTQQERNAFEN